MTIIRFPAHKLHHCEPGCTGCMFCDGGLALCVTCGGAEGSLPTDCPGEPMPELICEEVYGGAVDYRRGRGWVPESAGQKISVKGY